ncbi:centrosomal protein of 162 kDa-like [Periplaneta americana]|uniref:centrosomal protein of 162 kDa-like n=1 Tax=Periplaneta americana TaxID=6978 RepID=UPI0037E8B719
MCQRDLAVQSLRGEVHHLYRECLGLVRVKSDRDIQKQRPTESELDLPKDLERLEDILSEIEAVTHGSTYDDIFPRIKDQLHQKNHLESQLQLNVTSRDNLLRKRNHAQMMLTMLGTTMAETTAYHEEEEARILGEIEFQEKREGTMEVTIKERRDLLAAIRSSLQVIYEMVSRVNTESEDKVADLEQLLIVKPSTLPVPSSPMLDDAQEMINLITEKMEHIMSCLPEELDEEAIQNAATIMNEKQAAKAMSRIKFSATPIYETLLEDLNDIEDPNVPTRADIKKTDQMDMQLGSANAKSGNPNNQGKRI